MIRLGLISALVAAMLVAAVAQAAQPQRPSRHHQVFFADTPDELSVYRVYGQVAGKTLMIIGGIQGDEPGGFLSADLYADINLAKGNLIVVPRANFYSIILRHRGPDGDMNRQFADQVTAKRHAKIINVLKGLIAESDLLLNLHEGSGFFRPTWEGPMANPMRFGQSIIADADRYVTPNGQVIELQTIAERVLRRVNPLIKDAKLKFLFNNHRTLSRDSHHKEQRRSATYYALTQRHIPAFGVETSKSLPDVAQKIGLHKLVINAFMEDMGITPMNPGVYLGKPNLRYLVVGVNDQLPVVVSPGDALRVNAGDSVNVMHIEADCERGLSCDILGLGSVNDMRQAFAVNKNTKIVVRKDHQEIGRISLLVETAEPKAAVLRAKRLYFLVQTQDERRLLAAGETLRLVRGDKLQIVDLISNLDDQRSIEVNFKGFVPAKGRNAGEDRGHLIDTTRDLLPRFSSCAKASPAGLECYRVVATQNGAPIGEIGVEVSPAALDYLVVSNGPGPKMVYYNGETIRSAGGQRIEIIDLKTNVAPEGNLSLALYDDGGGKISLDGRAVDPASEPVRRLVANGQRQFRLVVLRREQPIGEVGLDLGGN
ncbi:M14/M99 family metallopeptidase [Desulfarculus baarsii]